MGIHTDKPITLCWLLTSKCNYSCKFCFKQSNREEISYDDAVNILEKITAIGVKKISFSGGEPLLWSGNVLELIKKAKSLGLITTLITNGSFLTESYLKELESHLDWLTLSLDASCEEMQVKVDRPAGHFTKIMELLGKADKFKLKINTMVCQYNLDDLTNMVDLIERHHVKRWRIFQFYPIRDLAIKNQEEYKITDEEFAYAAQSLMKKADKLSCDIDFATHEKLDKSYFLIAPDASIYCSANKQDHFIGNLKNDNIIDLWKSCQFVDKESYWDRTSWVLTEGI